MHGLSADEPLLNDPDDERIEKFLDELPAAVLSAVRVLNHRSAAVSSGATCLLRLAGYRWRPGPAKEKAATARTAAEQETHARVARLLKLGAALGAAPRTPTMRLVRSDGGQDYFEGATSM
ncbi:hypothetical protein ACFY3M_47395 [Streptomyces mirabilis]|uniref:hypothetical protein n=1 Tax=Streptomyces mirabilis TaxID=68239 RepID=UPI0036ACF0BB